MESKISERISKLTFLQFSFSWWFMRHFGALIHRPQVSVVGSGLSVLETGLAGLRQVLGYISFRLWSSPLSKHIITLLFVSRSMLWQSFRKVAILVISFFKPQHIKTNENMAIWLDCGGLRDHFTPNLFQHWV